MADQKTVKIFTLERQFPCGINSSCCGPIGLSEDDLNKLTNAIKDVGIAIEVYDITENGFSERYPSVANLLQSFGPGIVPILAVGDKIISMGTPSPEEAVLAVKENL